ncbi:hypothetical protein [Flavobacterium sp. YJ01]|uniref:hypothetical protein n=1 Tax=unclassified Flavobacterium TaxID=196869 RepID=UPI0023E413EB|nr:hypothetical protein [Flavobacterium sp. YJ01]WET00967.1 hypothetical protein P0R33_14420 [Flavobacterium sp. YJ01]
MRKLKAPFLAVAIILFNASVAFATPNPPAPTAKGANTNSTACTFCQDDGTPYIPIDQNIVFLAISGLILGMTVIYKNKTKKASI